MMDGFSVEENLLAARDYLKRLQQLELHLQNAENQVLSTAKTTELDIESTFNNLIEAVINRLTKRKNDLIKETRDGKIQGLKPLEDCRKIIEEAISKTESLIELGVTVVAEKNTHLDEFNQKASVLGCLPAVPDLKDVPCFTLEDDEAVREQILELSSTVGSVCHMAPIQIISTTEKPGAILVEWQKIETTETNSDIEEYRLQIVSDDVTQSKQLEDSFKDCYKGPDSQFLVKDIQPLQLYSFRVCCRFEGKSNWSPWSVVQVARTRIGAFCWKHNDSVVLSNNNKIVKSIINSPVFLFSDGPQFKMGDLIDFLFLEIGNSADGTFVGLSDKEGFKSEDMFGEGTFCVKASGEIFVDGMKKAMVLPEIKPGSKVSFGATHLPKNKMRISIDVNERRVTYDWTTDTNVLYFYAKLGSQKWKIMVE